MVACDAVEQLMQRRLGVAEGALHVRIVAAPEHVVEAHRRHRRDRRRVVLERRVNLRVDDLPRAAI